jgi:hypothetical protein
MFANVSTSMAEGIAAAAQVVRPGRADGHRVSVAKVRFQWQNNSESCNY